MKSSSLWLGAGLEVNRVMDHPGVPGTEEVAGSPDFPYENGVGGWIPGKAG